MSSLPTIFAPLHSQPSLCRTLTVPISSAHRPDPQSPPTVLAPSSPVSSFLPFCFGAEFEVIVRPKNIASLDAGSHIPAPGASHREKRNFSLALLRITSVLLSRSGLACEVYDPNQADAKPPNYSKWHVTLDASLSKKHAVDGFYPVEIVTPMIKAFDKWSNTIVGFWSIIGDHFELRQDTSCGMHIHISSHKGRFDLAQLKRIAKAIVFWERKTALCAPPSRDDRAQAFCLSNRNGNVPVAQDIKKYGPVQGLKRAFAHIQDARSCDNIVDYICSDKHRAWNLLPARQVGNGSVEFRRPPGVVDAEKALHWIAFTMAFMNLALTADMDWMLRRLRKELSHHRHSALDFEDLLRDSAEKVGVYTFLEPDLRQLDDPLSLHITTMRPDYLAWLRRFDPAYHISINA